MGMQTNPDISPDMSGHERCEQFDSNAINNSFLSSKSHLNLIIYLLVFSMSKGLAK